MIYYTHEQDITGRGDGWFINSREKAFSKFKVRYKWKYLRFNRSNKENK